MSSLRQCNICQQHHSQQSPELHNNSARPTAPLRPPHSRVGATCRAAKYVDLESLTPAYARATTNTRANSPTTSSSSKRSESPQRGRTQRRLASRSSNDSVSSNTDATSVTASSTGTSPTKECAPSEFLDAGILAEKSAAVPDEYLLSVRARDSIFFPIQVSSTLLWSRSGWFRKAMIKTSSLDLCASSRTGLVSDYATDSLRGKMITVPFTSSERLEQYIGLIYAGKVKFRPQHSVNAQRSCSNMWDLVNLYLLCVDFEDSISAKLVLGEVRTGLVQFSDNGALDYLTTSIWKSSTDGIKMEMQALRRQFRNWGLKEFGKWLPGVIEWMEVEGKCPDDLEHTYTWFQRDVIYDYWMDQE